MSNPLVYYQNDPEEDRECASGTLVGMQAKGVKGTTWKIVEKLNKKKNSSGGNFSVGYIVQDETGQKAFMKATDTGLITGEEGNVLSALDQAVTEHKFERQILDFCRGNNMDRIVHAVDYGDFKVTYKNSPEFVFFIIFELAEGDARSNISKQKNYDFVWALHALHNLSVAVNQLHTKDVTHNDIKPSNLLTFGAALQKLADMGRATHVDTSGPYDQIPCPGDQSYAAPELLYRMDRARYWGRIQIDYRKASDLYLLGSMSYFFITGSPLTPTILSIIRDEQMPVNWTGTFQEIMPYWRDAFGKAMLRFDEYLPKGPLGSTIPVGLELSTATRQLCEPDPGRRGHPNNQEIGRYSVERYTTLFDNLLKRSQIILRK